MFVFLRSCRENGNAALPSLAATLPAIVREAAAAAAAALSAPSDSSLFDSRGSFDWFCDSSSRRAAGADVKNRFPAEGLAPGPQL